MNIQLTTADAPNKKMQCYVAEPAQKGPGPAVVLLQEAFGVNKHIKDLANRYAQAGFLAIAPELYHRTAEPGLAIPYDNFAAVGPHMSAVSPETFAHDVRACVDWLKAEKRTTKVAATGYCMGGRAAFIANATVGLACAVSYYGGRILPDSAKLIAEQPSPLLFFWGGLDKHIPLEQIQSLNAGLSAANKVFTSVIVSNADHGFFCDDRPVYNPVAAGQSWALQLQFLRDNLQ